MNTVTTETKSRPILFSTEMVKAILDGRKKTQTRRIVKTPKDFGEMRDVFDDDYLNSHGFIAIDTSIGHGFKVRCPYGKVGDVLWVRETWRVDDYNSSETIYKADIPDEILSDIKGVAKWKPSIFMPRTASRITLEITNIRVERLQDITEVDAKAEGVQEGDDWLDFCLGQKHFAELWDKINEKRGYSWASNPFCWVLSFKRLKP